MKDRKSVAGDEDHLRCCGCYSGLLWTIKVAFIALEKGYDTKSVAIATMKRLRPTRRYGGYYESLVST